jgi:hypothetical protein
MRSLGLLFLIVFPVFAKAQHVGKVWTEIGLEGDLGEKFEGGLELTTRFDSYGLETIFPQLGVKYKLTKWMRPSIDYRFVSDRNKTGRYDISHRINANLDFKYKTGNLILKSRIRYQYSFDRFISSEVYEPEFDQAIRLKLSGEYDISKFALTPIISGEIFYDPMFGQFGRQVNKLRLFAGFKTDLKGPHSFSFGYMFDNRINLPKPLTRHILNLSYSYTIERKKED